MVLLEEDLIASIPATRFPGVLPDDEVVQDTLGIDEFSDNCGVSRFLYNNRNGTVEIHIGHEHFKIMFDYLDYKLNLPIIGSDFNVVVWDPKEKQNKPWCMRVDNMRSDSQIFWNAMLAICYGDD